MAQIKMQFVVTMKVNKTGIAEDMVELTQIDPPYVSPYYQGCKLILMPKSSDELKKYDEGTIVEAVLTIPG